MYDQHTDPDNRDSSNEQTLNDNIVWEEKNKDLDSTDSSNEETLSDNANGEEKNETNIWKREREPRNNHRERLLPHTLKLSVGTEGIQPVAYKDNTGYKLFASETIIIEPGEVKLVNTATKIELIPNSPEIKIDIQVDAIQEIQERHLYIVNNPGTIDLDYRGDIKIILWNYSNSSVTVSPGEPIAKLGFYKRIKGNIVTLKGKVGETNYE